MFHHHHLHDAASSGSEALLDGAINAGVDVNHVQSGATALARACLHGHDACVKKLLAAGADPSIRALVVAAQFDVTPLQLAAARDSAGHTHCVAALLQAGTDPWAVFTEDDLTALHLAAGLASLDAVRLLCEAAPVRVVPAAGGQPGAIQQPACLAQGRRGVTPLDVALQQRRFEVARYLIAETPWGPQHAGEVLNALLAAGDAAMPLFPALAARHPLTAEQWAQLPSPCPGLGAALPSVLWRSEAEAALLVRHMAECEREHLRTLALCLATSQRRCRLPTLPGPIAQQLLADSAAQFAAAPPEQQAAWHQAWATRQHKTALPAGASVAAAAAAPEMPLRRSLRHRK